MRDREYAACLRMLHEIAGTPVQVTASEPLGSEWAPVTPARSGYRLSAHRALGGDQDPSP